MHFSQYRIARSFVAIVAFSLVAASAGLVGAASLPARSLPDPGKFQGAEPARIQLPKSDQGQAFAITVWLEESSAARLASDSNASAESHSLPVRIELGDETIAQKFLHGGDPDLFLTIRCEANQQASIVIGESEKRVPAYWGEVYTMKSLSEEQGVSALMELEPNDQADQATRFEPGQTIYASADDRPFIPAPEQDEAEAHAAGVDWYQFQLEGSKPRLGYFWIDFLDRELPVDVALFQKVEGELKEYEPGFERFEPERSTKYVGMYKFVARKLQPGQYYLRVKAKHPAYQLRSELYQLPPYKPEAEGGLRAASEKAVRTAQDYILSKGESWHANTPRVGAVDNRINSVHAETAQCLACHPTHFATRGAVFSMANGYPVRRREALEFLTERLYNNPRPFYGHPQAHWSRMISAAGNVVSRLSIMLQVFEANISGRQRTSVHKDVAEYLKLYYEGRQELPKDESNGNRPLVSAFEVATHSWMVFDELYERTGEREYDVWRDKVQSLIESAGEDKVQDMLDLCYQTIAFCRIDSEKYADRIKDNVRKILSYQRDDGQWPMRFGEEEPPAEFQTGHCLYTLALAGVPVDDPHVDKAIRYLLGRQYPFGAWYDDDDSDHPHPYENFQTPFRETQFALMALSEYFPGAAKGGNDDSDSTQPGWQSGYASLPDQLDPESVPRILEQLDRTWVAGAPSLRQQITEALEHPHPLVRQMAAACLGRTGDKSAVEPLVKALGDPSKVVRRAAAWGVRQLGNRGLGYQAVVQSLQSSDPTVRRGTMQIFAQHGRYWVDQPEITRLLLEERMNDSDPYIRMIACRALWQWWYWTPDERIKSAIEDAYLERMAVEEHPWVRTNLIDGFYNVCDENIRYLYNNWISRLGTETARELAKAGEHDARARQARKIATVLREGNERQIKTVLRAVGFFHLRSGTYAGRGRFSRIGNDVRTVQFYKNAAPELKSALEPLVTADDPEMRGPALLTAYTLRNTGSADVFGVPYLKALNDADDYTRGVANEFYREFIPPVTTETEPIILETLAQLLESPRSQAQKAALSLIGELNLSREGQKQVGEAVKQFIARGEGDLMPQAFQAVAGLPSLWEESRVVLSIAKALRSDQSDLREAAVKLALNVDPLGGLTVIRSRLDDLFHSEDPEIQKMLLELAQNDDDIREHIRVAELVDTALQSDQSTVRQLGLDLVRNSQTLQNNAAVRSALSELLDDPNERTKQIAESIYSGKKIPYDQLNPKDLLDYAYFKEKVQPIFFAEGPDGKACYECHHNHGILKLTGPKDGQLTESISQANYNSALRVVDLAEPEKSLLLRKPLATSDSEGTVGGKVLSHGGELRWAEGQASDAYQAIRAWINGAEVDTQAETN